MSEVFQEGILAIVNDVRTSADVPELLPLSESDLKYAFCNDVSIVEEVVSENGSEAHGEKLIIQALQRILNSDQDADEQTNINYRALLNNYATHLCVTLEVYGQGFSAKILVVNKYLDLEPVGPLIGGDLVLQGTITNPAYGPVLCRVEFLADNEDELVEIFRVNPWEMMITQPPDSSALPSFTIPISLGSEYQDGTLRFLVYVEDMLKIPYQEIDSNFNPVVDELICAIEYTSRAADEEQVNARGVPMAQLNRVVANIQLLRPNDNKQPILDRGYIPACMKLSVLGILRADKDSTTWPYQMFVNHDSSGADGVEDIIWVRTPKNTGIVPELPEGYKLMENREFSRDEDELSVTLAVKVGPEAYFTNIFMILCDTKSRAEADRLVSKYLQDCGGGEYRPAPPEVCSAVGFAAGIVMITGFVAADTIAPASARKASVAKALESEKRSAAQLVKGGELDERDDDNLSQVTNSDDESDDEEEIFGNEQEAVASLTKRFTELEGEKEKARQHNLDLQRKCAALMAKLDRSGTAAGARANEASGDVDSSANENTSEKENHFIETLQLIQDARTKLSRQQSEFDQLNQDLQTRLDDKEFRVNEIAESFKAFKQEILRRSEHSRTGRGVSQRMIEQFELAEAKKDQELEQVRLRHISTRTLLRKLEKTLRAREQLAEGLHMIDFEQLKIENQTLNEKIEERNEELAKLKRKKTNTVQVLTHYREKTRFVEQNNEVLRKELEDLDAMIAKQRHLLNAYKHEKDSIRSDNAELKRRQGFATNDMLTSDFEKRKGTLEVMKASIKELQERHFLLTRQITVNTTKSRNKMSMSAGFTLPPLNSR